METDVKNLQNAAKAEAWMQFCDQWWLVVSDPEILKGLDIPDTWGIMAPPSGRLKHSMTVVKPAASLKPIHQADGLRRLVSWQLTQSETIVSPMRYTIQNQERELKALREKVYNSKDVQRDSPHHERISKIVLQVEAALQAESWMHRLNDQDVIDSLVDLTKVKTSQINISRALQLLSHPADRLRETLKRVDSDIKNLQNVTNLE